MNPSQQKSILLTIAVIAIIILGFMVNRPAKPSDVLYACHSISNVNSAVDSLTDDLGKISTEPNKGMDASYLQGKRDAFLAIKNVVADGKYCMEEAECYKLLYLASKTVLYWQKPLKNSLDSIQFARALGQLDGLQALVSTADSTYLSIKLNLYE
jgi:hypothetical protein